MTTRVYSVEVQVLCAKCRQKKVNIQIKQFDGETEYTHEITCPHCGHVHMDSWERC